jgi:hypothetical protein
MCNSQKNAPDMNISTRKNDQKNGLVMNNQQKNQVAGVAGAMVVITFREKEAYFST